MVRLAFALCLGLLVSCSTVSAPRVPSDGSNATRATENGNELDRDEIRADLDEAGRELALAELEAAHAVEVAQAELALAEHDEVLAKAGFQGFDAKMATDLDAAQLDIDRAISRLEEKRAELGELEAMYDEEEFAKTTKELVLTRGRRQVELAEKALEISRARLEVRRSELIAERLGAQKKVFGAELGRTKSEHELKTAELQGALDVLKAKRAVGELEEKLTEEEGGS